jgi:protein-tyrosine phosphatase
VSEPIRVLFVCLGNICRSPMADALLLHKVDQRGLSDRFEVDSAGTGAWHAGQPPDPRTQDTLRAHGVPVVGRARQVVPADFERFDHILAMDRSNLARLRRLAPQGQQDRLALTLQVTTGGEVPDPYYGDGNGFETVYRLLDEALDRWIVRWTT